MKYHCSTCGRSGGDVTPGTAPNGIGFIGSQSDMPGVAICKCTRCYEDDKTRACYPVHHRPVTLFDEWADLNQVICPWRSRFDDLRKALNSCQTLGEAAAALAVSGFLERYPLLPESLPVVGWVTA